MVTTDKGLAALQAMSSPKMRLGAEASPKKISWVPTLLISGLVIAGGIVGLNYYANSEEKQRIEREKMYRRIGSLPR